MTFEILLVFLILITALVLFFTAWVRMDIVALLVLGTLAVSGLVSPQEALSGFSNPAVVTVWAMFILSAALYQTGIAKIIGRQVLKLSGKSEPQMIVVIMLSSGLMSAIMNNIGVAVLMLPVVMDIARSTNRPPSRLLMPLAYGCLLGGLTTLIGTPPNLLVSFALLEAGKEPFGLFDYTPVGLGVMLGGILFIALIGRHILPKKDVAKENTAKGKKNLPGSYELHDRTFLININKGSELSGKTLSECRLRAALGINVLTVKRKGGGTVFDPGPDTVLRDNDKLFVQGRHDAIKALKEWKILIPEQKDIDNKNLNLEGLDFFEVKVAENSALIDKKVSIQFFQKNYKLNLIAIKHENLIWGCDLIDHKVQTGDLLLLHGPIEEADELVSSDDFEDYKIVSSDELINKYKLNETLFIMNILEDSELFDKAIAETQLGSAFGLTVLGIIRDKGRVIMPKPGEQLKPGDNILVQGNIDDLPLMRGLINIEILDERTPETQSLETADMQMAEIVMAPRSLLAGKTLREINFRNKYGVTVLAIWREGRAYRTNLHNFKLRHGEALLLYGKRDKLEMLGSESDFILLTDTISQPLRTHKALTAALVMLGILVPVLLGLIPLAVMAIIGIALMVLTGCLKMEEAYRAIEWRSVFLIAGMLPLGAAMNNSGAAAMLAGGVVNLLGDFGPWGIIIGLYVLTMLSTLAIHPAALVVIMSPIVLSTAETFDISPHTLMMAVAIAAASCFLSPISHPANLLVMGPGGYKFSDYIKLGLPLSIVVMIIALILLPIFWPL